MGHARQAPSGRTCEDSRPLKRGRRLYVVEHLDPELEQWQLLEYGTINKECKEAGCDFVLAGVSALTPEQIETMGNPSLSMTTENLLGGEIGSERVCLLDPKGTSELAPGDGDKFDLFVFGGILGDDPPRDRTAELRARGFQGRRLGPEQMTTDTAARVTRMVVEDKMPLHQIPYVHRPDMHLGDGESVSMPFKYVKSGEGKPVMPEGILKLLASDADKGILDLL